MEDDDRPIPKKTYNLDDLPPEAFGGGEVFGDQPTKPIKKPPPKFANKAKTLPSSDPVDEAPIKPAKAANLDDLPLGSSKSADQPMNEGGEP